MRRNRRPATFGLLKCEPNLLFAGPRPVGGSRKVSASPAEQGKTHEKVLRGRDGGCGRTRIGRESGLGSCLGDGANPVQYHSKRQGVTAGCYEFKPEGPAQNHVTTRNPDTSETFVVPVVTRLADTGSAKAQIAFDVAEGEHYLSEVHIPGTDGYAFQGASGQRSHAVVTPKDWRRLSASRRMGRPRLAALFLSFEGVARTPRPKWRGAQLSRLDVVTVTISRTDRESGGAPS